MKVLIGIQFKAVQKIYEISPTGEYEMSNLNGEDLIEFKTYFAKKLNQTINHESN